MECNTVIGSAVPDISKDHSASSPGRTVIQGKSELYRNSSCGQWVTANWENSGRPSRHPHSLLPHTPSIIPPPSA